MPAAGTVQAVHLAAVSATTVAAVCSVSRSTHSSVPWMLPAAGNLHGTDEWVDVETLVQTATVVALAAAEWTA